MSDKWLMGRVPREWDITQENWRILRVFNYLRLIIALALAIFFCLKISINEHSISYYLSSDVSAKLCQTYLGFIVITLLLTKWCRVNFEAQVFLTVMVDISVLTMLIYYNDIIVMSLIVLICAIIAGGCVVARNKSSIFFAAFASLVIIAVYIAQIISNRQNIEGLLIAGLSSCSYFFTAILIYGISRNMRLTKELAEQQATDIVALKNLNAQVIQHLRIGVLVIDEEQHINMINPVAEKFLSINAEKRLLKIDPKFTQRIAEYRKNSHSNLVEIIWGNNKLLLYCVNLPKTKKNELLIFIEDADLTERRAQQLKLASMGKFTAGIAHEIRNPLSAINQAAELLGQNLSELTEKIKLTDIICNNVKRIDAIIKTVLQLSRQKKEAIVIIEVVGFLKKFIEDFNQDNSIVELKSDIKESQVQFDPQQLTQVLINLCENAQRYNAINKKITLKLIQTDVETYLDIIDYGSGIAEQDLYNIFEPFYTTDAKGTGLGLYMSRELCQANHAELTASNHEMGGACFRIAFGKIL